VQPSRRNSPDPHYMFPPPRFWRFLGFAGIATAFFLLWIIVLTFLRQQH
jgi:hypothetical protein